MWAKDTVGKIFLGNRNGLKEKAEIRLQRRLYKQARDRKKRAYPARGKQHPYNQGIDLLLYAFVLARLKSKSNC